jgi:hypothetical protein
MISQIKKTYFYEFFLKFLVFEPQITRKIVICGNGEERMGTDGNGWERMGTDGNGWERMGTDGNGGKMG